MELDAGGVGFTKFILTEFHSFCVYPRVVFVHFNGYCIVRILYYGTTVCTILQQPTRTGRLTCALLDLSQTVRVWLSVVLTDDWDKSFTGLKLLMLIYLHQTFSQSQWVLVVNRTYLQPNRGALRLWIMIYNRLLPMGTLQKKLRATSGKRRLAFKRPCVNALIRTVQY